MSLLVYAVSEAGQAPVEGTGLAGATLSTIVDHGLAAIVTDGPPVRLEPTEDALWEYEQVIERLMAGKDVLPLRFGSVLEDEAAARALLGERESELHRSLDRVRGAVEFGLSAAWREPPPPPADDSGTAYLRGRLELHRRAAELARRLDPLATLARESRQRVLPTPSLPFSAAYLLERERTGEFIELMRDLDASVPGVDLICTGPWPPYSFVKEVS